MLHMWRVTEAIINESWKKRENRWDIHLKKKTKTDEDSRKVKEIKERAAERLRKMTIREICLIMKRVIFAEEELEEIPIKY